MQQVFQYYGRFNDYRQQFGGLPSWARTVVGVAAVPGTVLILLSLLVLGVSILALLLLTVPVYRLLQAVTGSGANPAASSTPGPLDPGLFGTGELGAGRKRVDVKVVD